MALLVDKAPQCRQLLRAGYLWGVLPEMAGLRDARRHYYQCFVPSGAEHDAINSGLVPDATLPDTDFMKRTQLFRPRKQVSRK
jgi:hypothetical protein